MKRNWHLLGTATVNQNGGVTLPAGVRKTRSLNTGDKVVWFEDEEGSVFIVSEYEYRQFLATVDTSELITHHLEILGITETKDAQISHIKSKKK